MNPQSSDPAFHKAETCKCPACAEARRRAWKALPEVRRQLLRALAYGPRVHPDLLHNEGIRWATIGAAIEAKHVAPLQTRYGPFLNTPVSTAITITPLGLAILREAEPRRPRKAA